MGDIEQVWYFLTSTKKKSKKGEIRIFQEVKISKKNKCPIFVTLTLTPWTFFFYSFFVLFMGSRINACYFLDFQKVQKGYSKGKL